MTAVSPEPTRDERALTTAEVRQRLVKRYAKRSTRVLNVLAGQPEHAVLFEVPLDGRQRWAESDIRSKQRIDAVAVGLWSKTTRHRVLGFEIKVSRSDLLRELKDPTKADAGIRVCDEWWLVLGAPSLLRDTDNLPHGWGVLVPHGRGLRVHTAAATMHPEHDGSFVAGLVQSALRGNGQMARGMGYLDGFNAGKKWAFQHPKIPQWQLDALQRENDRLNTLLAPPTAQIVNAR